MVQIAQPFCLSKAQSSLNCNVTKHPTAKFCYLCSKKNNSQSLCLLLFQKNET